jgi:hypothetical protein
MQLVAGSQDTPVKPTNFGPTGFGVDWTVQDLPSHASANVAVECRPDRYHPAAAQAL